MIERAHRRSSPSSSAMRMSPKAAPGPSRSGSARPTRGLGAVAKTLSMDMRANDHGWLEIKLDALAKTPGDSFELPMPPTASASVCPSVVSPWPRSSATAANSSAPSKHDGPPGARRPVQPKNPKPAPTARCPGRCRRQNPATGEDSSSA